MFYSYFTFLTYSIKKRVLSNSEVLIKDIDIEFRYWIDIDSILNQNEPIPVIMGDFNATGVKKRCNYDTSKNEQVQIDSVTETHSFEQIIYESTHILFNYSSCVEFTSTTNHI